MTAAADIVAVLANAGPAGADSVDLTMWLRFLGRLHPMVVHFPLALILVAAGLESLMVFRKGRRVSRTAVTCLVIGAVAAGVAAWVGWLNAEHEPRGESVAFTLLLHRWIGVSAAGVALIAMTFGLPARFGQRWAVLGYRWMLLLAAGLIGAGGFFGGELVHGRGYLVAVFREPAPVPDIPRPVQPVDHTVAAIPVSFADDIRPILAENCADCHVPDRRRGDLVLVPISAAFARPPAEWVIRPGKPGDSALLTRVRLPADHPDRMPRDGDPLTDAQVSLLARWIAQGAPHEKEVQPPPPPLPPPPPPVEPVGPTPEEIATQARSDAIEAIRGRGGVVALLADDRPDVEVNFRVTEPKVADADLALLGGLEPCLVRLDLSSTAVTDAGLRELSSFTALERLRLDKTAITDAGVEAIAQLDSLTWLNLVSTAVTDASIEKIASLTGLEQVYIWKTRISASGAAHLRRLRPGLEVITAAPILPPEPPREEPDGEEPTEPADAEPAAEDPSGEEEPVDEDPDQEKEDTNDPDDAVAGDDDPT